MKATGVQLFADPVARDDFERDEGFIEYHHGRSSRGKRELCYYFMNKSH